MTAAMAAVGALTPYSDNTMHFDADNDSLELGVASLDDYISSHSDSATVTATVIVNVSGNYGNFVKNELDAHLVLLMKTGAVRGVPSSAAELVSEKTVPVN
eukprot:IDg8724t1